MAGDKDTGVEKKREVLKVASRPLNKQKWTEVRRAAGAQAASTAVTGARPK